MTTQEHTENINISPEKTHHQQLPNGQVADTLQRLRTAGSITLSPEMFEQLYLAPQNKVKGELRRTFGNPTPIAIGGFLLCAMPLSMTLLGWQGAGGLGAANVYVVPPKLPYKSMSLN
jgi:uncharacterized protein